MFTGLVRAPGTVQSVTRTASGAELRIDIGELASSAAVGDSICVSGTCLTVTRLDGNAATFDAVRETLDRTTLGTLQRGGAVNLEPALRVGDALGGHFVSGHIDGQAELVRAAPAGDGSELTFAAEAAVIGDVVIKGSVAIDGISLTVAGVSREEFRVAVIPHTLRTTTLEKLRPGDRVNVETDMLVKAVRRIIAGGAGGGGMSMDFLREHGFA